MWVEGVETGSIYLSLDERVIKTDVLLITGYLKTYLSVS